MSNTVNSNTKPWLSNRAYDAWKYIAQIVLPGLGTLYFALSAIWGLPYGEQVVGTITAVDVFLGALLLLSAKSYANSDAKFDGALVVNESLASYSLDVDTPLSDVENKGVLTLKVVPKVTDTGV